MRDLDDFILDRVFQPVADWLAPWRSCYGLAAFLMLGAIILALIGGCALFPALDGFLLLFVILFWVPRLRRCEQLDCRSAERAIPRERLADHPWRLIFLGYSGWGTWRMWCGEPAGEMAGDAAWIMNTLALWFMACRKNPPRRRRSVALAEGAA